MNIFESLENLNVSEECFEDIVRIVEELLSEGVNLDDMVSKLEQEGKIPRKPYRLHKKAAQIKGTNDFYYKDGKGYVKSGVPSKNFSKSTLNGNNDTSKNEKDSIKAAQRRNTERRMKIGEVIPFVQDSKTGYFRLAKNKKEISQEIKNRRNN